MTLLQYDDYSNHREITTRCCRRSYRLGGMIVEAAPRLLAFRLGDHRRRWDCGRGAKTKKRTERGTTVRIPKREYFGRTGQYQGVEAHCFMGGKVDLL